MIEFTINKILYEQKMHFGDIIYFNNRNFLRQNNQYILWKERIYPIWDIAILSFTAPCSDYTLEDNITYIHISPFRTYKEHDKLLNKNFTLLRNMCYYFNENRISIKNDLIHICK